LPVPELPEFIVIQEKLLVAIQTQPPLAVTLALPLPPAAPIDALAGEMAYEQPAPAWVTVKLAPAIVRAPVRVLLLVLACTE
jgi:hypothetical protein